MSPKVKLNYVVLDVFTDKPYLGNPLAIVHIPPSVDLSQEKKQLIAREFNLSESVFIHDDSLPKDGLLSDRAGQSPIVIDIFVTEAEIPFAGHPTVGTGNYLLHTLLPTRFPSATFPEISLLTKAGIIPVTALSSPAPAASLRAPIAFKVHEPYAHPHLKPLQAQLTDDDYVEGTTTPVPVVSIVRGMTFFLLALSSEDALARFQGTPRLTLPEGHLGEWAGPVVAVYAFVECANDIIKTRLFFGPLEDPATGSAASALCGYICQKRGPGKRKLHIIQGVDMGRRSDISVTVDVDMSSEVTDIILEGSAIQVMQGELEI